MTTISHLSLFMIVLIAGILLGAADEIYENRNIKSANGGSISHPFKFFLLILQL